MKDKSPQKQGHSQAEQAFILDILEQALRQATNPGGLSREMLEQLRGLTGARLAALYECRHEDGRDHRLIHVNPARRRTQAESAEVIRLVQLADALEGPAAWTTKTGGEQAELLARHDLSPSIAVPLHVGADHVGVLLLLGLPPDPYGEPLVIDMLSLLSTVMALILQNALFFQKQETVIEARTQALHRSEARYRALFNEAPSMYVITRDEGGEAVIADCNAIFLSTLGYEREQVMGRPLADFYDEGSKVKLIEGRYKRAQTGMITAAEQTLVTSDGRHIPTMAHARPHWDQSSHAGGTLAVYVDITRLVEAEAEARRYTERLNALLELDRAVQEVHSLEDVAGAALDRITSMFVVLRASIAIFDLKEGVGLIIAVRGSSQAARGALLPLSVWPVNTLQQGELALTPDIDAVVNLEPTYRMLREQGVRSFLNVPLIARDELVGVLNLGAGERDAFGETEIEIAREVAEPLAIAVRQARLLEQVQRQAAELEQRVAERTEELQRRLAENEQLNRALANVLEDLQAANRRAEQYARQLEIANEELEAFSYSISHDLRAPLRAVDGFGRILEDEYGPELPPEAQRYLNLIRDNTRQMGALIQDLLAFSRLGRQPLRKQEMGPTKLVRQLVEEIYQPQMPDRVVQFQIADLPACRADPTLLRQVFANLLENGLKFTQVRETAVIEVGFRQEEDGTVYFVRDNGVGFDMRYADKMFGVFQRLHRVEEYEGTGIGLATVQRIIHRHGGKIWAEAEPDQGSTFYFTLGVE